VHAPRTAVGFPLRRVRVLLLERIAPARKDLQKMGRMGAAKGTQPRGRCRMDKRCSAAQMALPSVPWSVLPAGLRGTRTWREASGGERTSACSTSMHGSLREQPVGECWSEISRTMAGCCVKSSRGRPLTLSSRASAARARPFAGARTVTFPRRTSAVARVRATRRRHHEGPRAVRLCRGPRERRAVLPRGRYPRRDQHGASRGRGLAQRAEAWHSRTAIPISAGHSAALQEGGDGWWEGTLNGESGIFPENYVEVRRPAVERRAPEPASPRFGALAARLAIGRCCRRPMAVTR